MIWATRGGDGWLWYTLGALLLIFGRSAAVRPLSAAGLAVGAGSVCFIAVKRKFKRRRPCAIADHCWADLLPPDQFSFPSGHTITAFAFAVSVGLFYPALMAALLFCAVSVAVSRVMLGMHFLSDVIAGAAIGTALAYAAVALLR